MIELADAQGVAFTAIQGLNTKVEQRLAVKDAEIAALRAIRSILATITRAKPTQTAVAGPYRHGRYSGYPRVVGVRVPGVA
jgi:hypothetical protein